MDCNVLITLNTIFSLVFFIFSLVLPLMHILLSGQSHYKMADIYEIMLKYSLFFNVGCAFLLTFVGQCVYAPEVASCMGWQHSVFQYEVAFSQLGVAVIGFLCVLYTAEFWLSAIIGASVWLWGAAIVHIVDSILRSNYSIGNIGFTLYWDLFLPFWLIGLYYIWVKAHIKDNDTLARVNYTQTSCNGKDNV